MPKRTPVPASASEAPKPKKRPPPGQGPRIDRIPEPATPERLQEVALEQHGGTAAHGLPPLAIEDDGSPESKTGLFRWLRWAAGMYYTTDLRGCTVEALSRHPMFAPVSIVTMARWSVEDRWVERRQQNLDAWRRAIENKIGTELVQAYRDGLAKAVRIYDKIFDKLDKEVVAPKSYEGLVTAFVKLADLMADWNDRIARAIIPDMPAQTSTAVSGPAETARPRLTQDEARAAVKIVLSRRREEMRAKLRQDDDTDVIDTAEDEDAGTTLDA